jgi:cytochrome P450
MDTPTKTATTGPALRPPLPEELTERTDPFDLPPALVALGERAPVNRMTMPTGDPFWLVSGYAEARVVLSDPRFSSDRFRNEGMVRHVPEEYRERLRDEKVRAGSFISMDPPEHTRYRRLLTGQFTVRRMRELGARIEEIVTGRLDAMLANGNTADLVPEFALPVPSLVICELLGVRYDDRAEFQRRTATLLKMHVPIEEVLETGDALRAFMRKLIADKRANPTDDLISGLIHHAGADPALTDDELVNIANLLLVAGHETTANMLALGTFALLERPEQLAALRDDPSRIDDAIEELLRYLSIVHLGLFRFPKEDVEVGGALIPAGATVVISVLAANRDSAHWPHPEALDVTRARGPHLAFGHGVHQCLGQQLARVEMTVGFSHLLRRLPNLRLAVPAGRIPLRTDMFVYGVHSLPVTWDAP